MRSSEPCTRCLRPSDVLLSFDPSLFSGKRRLQNVEDRGKPKRSFRHLSPRSRLSSVGELEPEGLNLSAGAGRNTLVSVLRFLSALYRFTRPHTMLGTAASVLSISFLAAGRQAMVGQALIALMQALSSALLMNVCIVGINQIFDVDIDRMNKPYLPLAAGDFSKSTAYGIVIVTGVLSLLIGMWSESMPLLSTLVGSLLLGIAYSTDLPFLRWKRHPLAAALCILTVRAVLVQLGFFFHMKSAVDQASIGATRTLLFATGFMLLFSIVIALFKDIPDVSGDSAAGVRTLSVRIGQRRVFWLCVWLLEAAYMAGVAVAMAGEGPLELRLLAAGMHAAVGWLIHRQAAKTNLDDSHSIYKTYMDVWKAFYFEYLLLPLFHCIH